MAAGLDNLGIAAPSIDLGSIGAVISIALPIVLLVVGIWLVLYLAKFNIKVNIYNPTTTGSIKEVDKGAKQRDKKTKTVKEFVLMKNKKDWKGNIPQKFFIPTTRMFGRVGYELNMIRDEEGNLQPIMPPNHSDVTAWDGMGPSDIAWALAQIEEGYNTFMKQDFLSKYGAVLVPLIGFIIIMVMMLVLFQELEPLAGAFKSAATTIAEAMKAQGVQQVTGVTP